MRADVQCGAVRPSDISVMHSCMYKATHAEELLLLWDVAVPTTAGLYYCETCRLVYVFT